MSGKSIISNSYLEDIGDAIRYKKGTEQTFYPSQMGDAIRSIEGIVPVGSIEIDANGTYDVTEKAEAVVSVEPDLRPLSVSENGTYQPDDFDGYSDVTVDVEPALESLSVTENGLYLPTAGVDGYDRVTVDVPAPDLESLTIDTLTQSGTFLPTGDGFSQVSAEEDWDGTLYPITDETDPIYDSKPFDAHWVQLSAGDTIIIEGYGRGRWVGFRGITTVNISSLPSTVNINVRSQPAGQFDYLRFRFDAVEDCIAVLASTNGSKDGTHSGQVGYCFCGDYMKWKVIHQP